LHGHPVDDKLRRIVAQGSPVYKHVYNDTAHRNPEVVEPVDETFDDGDGQGLRQRDKEKGGFLGILSKVLAWAIRSRKLSR